MYREGMVIELDDSYQRERRNPWSRKIGEEWQRRWNIADEGRWTLRVTPCVVKWTGRRHGLVTFHLTQVLTGHSCFRSYLKGIGVYRSARHVLKLMWTWSMLCSCLPAFGKRENRSEGLMRRLLGRCLLSTQTGWNAGIDIRLVDGLNRIRKERREEERIILDIENIL